MDSLILASKSPRRIEILRKLGIPFVLCTIDIDEAAIYRHTVRSFVMQVSREKASAATTQYSRGLIAGVDTVVFFNGRILGKPADEDTAHAYIRMLSGNRHQVFSGITVRDAASGRTRTVCSASSVHFAKMSEVEISRYIVSGEWTDKAGGYAVQGRAAMYIKSIEGSYYNIMGLPVEELYSLLKYFGYFDVEGRYEPARRKIESSDPY
jgi:septum formation protein